MPVTIKTDDEIARMRVAGQLASSVLDWKLLTLGVFVLFVYILLVTTPVWLAWLEDDLHEEIRHQDEIGGRR